MPALLKNNLLLLLACALFLGAILFTHAEYRNADMKAECMPANIPIPATSIFLHGGWLTAQSILLGLSFYVVVFVENRWAPYMLPVVTTQRVLWLSLVIGTGGLVLGTNLHHLLSDRLLFLLISASGMGAIGCLFWFLLSASLLLNERAKLRFHLADLLVLTLYSGIGIALTQLTTPDARILFLVAWFLNALFSFLAYALTRNEQKFWLPVMLAVGFFMFPAYWVLLVALQPRSEKPAASTPA
jgi:hypothetical protein